jgi:hypothetical protein
LRLLKERHGNGFACFKVSHFFWDDDEAVGVGKAGDG